MFLMRKNAYFAKKTFTPQKNHPQAEFCSKKCNKRDYYLKRRKFDLKYPMLWDTKKHCKFCNKQIRFNRNKYIVSELAKKFCSEKCRRAVANIKRKKHILKSKKCLFCEGMFTPHYLHPQAKFCSEKCNKAYMYYNKNRSLISKYPKGFDTLKHCKRCGRRIVLDNSKPMNTELIRNYCNDLCRGREAHQRFKIKNPKGYKEKTTKRRLKQLEKQKGIIQNFRIKDWIKIRSKGVCFGYNRRMHFVGRDNVELDHRYPVSRAYQSYLKTGRKRIYNLRDIQPLCRNCNQSKSDKI
jgi:hypothetical protein